MTPSIVFFRKYVRSDAAHEAILEDFGTLIDMDVI